MELQTGSVTPVSNRVARLLTNFKLNRLSGLLLYDLRTSPNFLAVLNVAQSEHEQVTPSQFAVQGQIKQGKVSCLFGDLEPNAYAPNLRTLQRWLLTNQLSTVPRHIFANGLGVHQSLLVLVRLFYRRSSAIRPLLTADS